jgi:hypothetical protein
MSDFDELVASRKEWIDNVLRPWCVKASLRDLKKADAEWADIAGRVDVEATLWTWAWSRFDDLVHEGLSGVSETYEVQVTFRDGSRRVGFPDARKSKRGQLVLVCQDGGAERQAGATHESGPHSIDNVADVERV